jgi:TolB protein
LYAVALDCTRTVRLTDTRAREDDPAVSPDGRSIAFTTSTRGIWVMGVDGKVRKRLTRGSDSTPAWSPDGKTVFFARGHQDRYGATCEAIFRVGTTGRNERRFKTYGATNYDPAVSPDSSRIAFSASNACEGGTAVYAILVMDASGHRTNDLARLPGNSLTFPNSRDHQDPTWSPDGRRLAFHPWGSGIYTANRDGTNQRRVTAKRQNGSAPSWSPDGKWIAWQRIRPRQYQKAVPSGR